VVDDGRQLETLARGDARDALRDCPVGVPTVRPIPYLAYWTDTNPAHYAEGAAETVVTPTETSESWIGGGGEGQPARVVLPPPAGATPVAEDDAWRVYATC
jgi:hypothetical protein